MTISAVYSPDTYAGDGSTTTFAITFSFLSVSTNVKVSIKVDSTGVITEKTAATHYNVSGSNVVFTAGNIPASGETVIIELNPDFKQESDYSENSSFPAETVETDLDERCLEGQINNNLVGSSLKIDSSLSGVTTTIVASSTNATNADKYIKFNSDGDGFEVQALSASAGLGAVVDDTTPQLGGNLDVNGFDITSPDGTDLVDIVNGTITVKTNSTTRLDVTDSGVQLGGSGARVTTVLDEDTMSSDSATALATQQSIKAYVDSSSGLGNVVEDTTPQLGGSLDVNGNKIVSTSNGNIDIEPNGTGNVLLGNLTFDADQTVGAGQDNYVLTYDNGTGLIALEASSSTSAASQAEQEAGTEAGKYVAPATQHFHDSAAKAWANWTDSGTATLQDSYNVTSITDNATGDYTITWDTDFSSANYAWACNANEAANDLLIVNSKSTAAPAAGTIRIVCHNSGATDTDTDVGCIVAFGDL